jgi:hypothetical protein
MYECTTCSKTTILPRFAKLSSFSPKSVLCKKCTISENEIIKLLSTDSDFERIQILKSNNIDITPLFIFLWKLWQGFYQHHLTDLCIACSLIPSSKFVRNHDDSTSIPEKTSDPTAFGGANRHKAPGGAMARGHEVKKISRTNIQKHNLLLLQVKHLLWIIYKYIDFTDVLVKNINNYDLLSKIFITDIEHIKTGCPGNEGAEGSAFGAANGRFAPVGIKCPPSKGTNGTAFGGANRREAPVGATRHEAPSVMSFNSSPPETKKHHKTPKQETVYIHAYINWYRTFHGQTILEIAKEKCENLKILELIVQHFPNDMIKISDKIHIKNTPPVLKNKTRDVATQTEPQHTDERELFSISSPYLIFQKMDSIPMAGASAPPSGAPPPPYFL